MKTRCLTDYDKRITFYELDGTPNAHGQIDNTDPANWKEFTVGFAHVQSKGGREFWKVDQVSADVSHVWWTQWTRKLDEAGPDLRLTWEGKTYEILSIIDIDLAHEEFEIQTRRAV